MGLDFVELILETEEAFGISLPDEAMAESVTVGQFFDAILRALPHPEKKFCLSAVAFYRLHRPILTVTGRKHGEVRPTTRLDTLFPRGQRKAAWKKIERLSGLRLPSLNVPIWAILLVLACAVLAVAAHIFFQVCPSYMAIVSGIVTFIFAYKVADAIFGTDLPNNYQTVGELTKAVLASNFAKLSGEIADFDCNEVWESVRILVSDQLGVGIEKITKEARFVTDLGMD